MNESEDVRLIQDLFRKADEDKNGSLSRTELRSIMTILLNGKEPTTQDVDRLFEMIDSDGSNSIEEAEFTKVLSSWLKVSRKGHDDSVTSPRDGQGITPGRLKRELSIQRYDMSSRRKCQTDIVNFFQQFDSKATDPQTVIQRILNSQSSELDLKSIRHNIRQYSKEEKAKIHTKIYTMAQFGQSAINSCILGLHSPKNEDIYTSLLFVRELLEITEAFTTNSERLEMAVLFVEVFEALVMTPTHLLGADMRPLSSIITRVLLLLQPSTPTHILLAALSCLRNFALGPNIPSLDISSPWHPEKHLTKVVLEGQSFLPRILMLMSSFPIIDSSSHDILNTVFDTITAYIEYRLHNLRQALSLGLRDLLLNYFRQPMSIVMMRSITCLLGVLSGYTHTWDESDLVEARASNNASLKDLPVVQLLIWPTEQLQVLLSVCNKTYQDMTDSYLIKSIPGTNQGSMTGYDSLVVINIAIIMQQCLSFCDIKNPLFVGLIGQALTILRHYQSEYVTLCSQLSGSPDAESGIIESTQIFEFVVRTIDSALTELCYNFPEVADALLQNEEFIGLLKQQLKSYALLTSASRVRHRLGDGLDVIRCAMDVLYAMIETGFLSRVLTLFGESVFLLSNISSIRHWIVKILYRCCSQDAGVTAEQLADIGILDLLFGLLPRFKTYHDPSEDFLALSQLGAFYDLDLLDRLLATLTALASLYNVTPTGDKVMRLGHKFAAEHVDSLVLLHTSICYELSLGNLVSPGEANDINRISHSINDLLQLLMDGLMSVNSPHSRLVKEIVTDHLGRWTEDLTNAYDAGMKLVEDNTYTGRRRSFMDTDSDGGIGTKQSKIIRGLPFLHIESSSEYMIILRPVIPTIQNGIEVLQESDDEKRYFVSPDVSLKDLKFSASYLFEHMVSLFIKCEPTIHNPSIQYVPIETDEQLSGYIKHITELAKQQQNQNDPVKKIQLFAMSSRSSLSGFVNSDLRLKMLENAVLPPKDQVLTDLRRLSFDQSVKIDMGMMENFYKFFESKRKVEIDLSLFEEAMTAVSVPREFAGDMFRAFDIDMSGTLSLKEIAVGLGKLMDGDQEDILHVVFRAYDLDHNDSLDFSEITHMIAVALGVQHDLAAMYASAAFQAMKIHPNGNVSFIEFRDAVYSGKLQVGGLWASGLPTLRSENTRPKPSFYQRSNWNGNNRYDSSSQNESNFANAPDNTAKGGKYFRSYDSNARKSPYRKGRN